MGRKRKPRLLGPWDIITDELVTILTGLKIKRTSRDYFNTYYNGTTKELRKACIRILNVLDSMEREGDEDGTATTFRRT